MTFFYVDPQIVLRAKATPTNIAHSVPYPAMTQNVSVKFFFFLEMSLANVTISFLVASQFRMSHVEMLIQLFPLEKFRIAATTVVSVACDVMSFQLHPRFKVWPKVPRSGR
jgi:hypothetical protein